MNLKQLLLSRLLASQLNQSDATATTNESFISERQATSFESAENSVRVATNSPYAQTVAPSFETFPPVGPLTSYILVTPRGVNQVSNLTFYEQSAVYFSPLTLTSELNYLYVEADERIAKKLKGNKFLNKALPLLREISVNKQKFCHSKVEGYMIIAIGALKSKNMIEDATAVGISESSDGQQHLFPLDDIVVAAENSPNKIYDVPNPGFYGSEFLVYSYDGNIGEFTEQSTLDSFKAVRAFAEVLNIARIRNSIKIRIFYAGDIADPLVSQLISSVNKTIPVFLTLDDTLKSIMMEFFHDKFPGLELNEFGCPQGVQTKQARIEVKPLKCSPKLRINGIDNDIKDYGMEFTVQKTNRWFSLKIETQNINDAKATFSIRFNREGLILLGDRSIISSVGIPENDNEIQSPLSNITFAYNGLIDSKPYEIRLKAEQFKFGLQSEFSAQIDIRKKGAVSFENIGIFNIHAQPQTVQFCGFSPIDNIRGVNKASTVITNFESQFINNDLQDGTKPPKPRVLRLLA